jgi:hypothetical protein
MTYRAAARMAAFTVMVCCMAMVPAAAASASRRSIEVAIASYGSKIEVAEQHVEAAAKEYEQSKDPAVVQRTLGESASVLGAMEHRVASQSAGVPKGKRAKTKIVNGLKTIIGGYKQLSSAYGERAANPGPAEAAAAKAVATIKKGHKQFLVGIDLLK